MRAVFADTFYWAALTSTEDAAHERAMQISRFLKPERIITTDEVLDEYPAFFSGARASVRAQAANNVAALISSSLVQVVP
jgi:predicted nucleic acid-binding protein